jgi:hypothetical protein
LVIRSVWTYLSQAESGADTPGLSGASAAVVGPPLGQIEFAVQKRVAALTGIVHKNTDLAVFDPSCGAAVSALDPAGMLAFLYQTALIQDGDPFGPAQVFDDKVGQFVAKGIRVSAGTVQAML